MYTVGINAKQDMINQPQGCSKGQSVDIQKFFYATCPFSKLAVKKMVASENPSVAVSKIVITSYSIHYTKLYDMVLAAVERVPKQRCLEIFLKQKV